jgi:hypothetical protein
MITMTTYACAILIALLAVALLMLGLRAYRNEQEIRRLRRNGHRRLAFRRCCQRGWVDANFLRCLAELTLLLLLLAAVFGWLGLRQG